MVVEVEWGGGGGRAGVSMPSFDRKSTVAVDRNRGFFSALSSLLTGARGVGGGESLGGLPNIQIKRAGGSSVWSVFDTSSVHPLHPVGETKRLGSGTLYFFLVKYNCKFEIKLCIEPLESLY